MVVKKTVDEYGRVKYADDLVIEFLRSEGEKTFGEIRQYLENKGIKYYDNTGLYLTLTRQREKGIIDKRMVQGNSYPTWYIISKGLTDMHFLSQSFRFAVHNHISKFPPLLRQDHESDQEYFIRALIHIIGFYNLYVQIQSWKFTSNKKSRIENFENRSKWLQNTLPNGIESTLFEKTLLALAGIPFYHHIHEYKNVDEFKKSKTEIYEDEKKQKKLREIENFLRKNYHNEMKFFEKLMQDVLDNKLFLHR
jgi:hypothetical protein